jgi:hypothetical protein
MSFDRPLAGTGMGAEPAPTPTPQDGLEVQAADGVSPQMRLQILSTEHWSLLASRSLAWNESFSRGGMFLATLSGAIVALALVAQAMLISVLNSVLIGAIVALLILQVGGGTVIAVVASVIAFIAGMASFLTYAGRQIAGVRAELEPRFPTKTPVDA